METIDAPITSALSPIVRVSHVSPVMRSSDVKLYGDQSLDKGNAIVNSADKVVGFVSFRLVHSSYPLSEMLRFLREPSIRRACRHLPADFLINYYWLESLYVVKNCRGQGIASRTLDHICSLLPPQSVIGGLMHQTGDVTEDVLERFYSRNQFHICRNTLGNKGTPIIFTFVKHPYLSK